MSPRPVGASSCTGASRTRSRAAARRARACRCRVRSAFSTRWRIFSDRPPRTTARRCCALETSVVVNATSSRRPMIVRSSPTRFLVTASRVVAAPPTPAAGARLREPRTTSSRRETSPSCCVAACSRVCARASCRCAAIAWASVAWTAMTARLKAGARCVFQPADAGAAMIMRATTNSARSETTGRSCGLRVFDIRGLNVPAISRRVGKNPCKLVAIVTQSSRISRTKRDRTIVRIL